MIKLRNMACAYLFNSNEVLMMKRSSKSKLLAGFWAPVGGHMEPDEINNPTAACLREIHEEIGLVEDEIQNLTLKYITVRRKDDEIRVQYIHFGTTSVRNLKECDEGELHWINQSDIFELNMSVTNMNALEHYFKTGKDCSNIFVGVVEVSKGMPIINWTVLDS